MDYINKPTLMGKLTSSEEQKKIKAMTGEEAYNEFLMLVNSMEKADVDLVRRQSCKFCRGAGYTEKEFTVTTQLGRTVRTQFNFCPNCGARMDGGTDNG